jgi:predicted DNA-binding protein (MmcQ/YjbR family)
MNFDQYNEFCKTLPATSYVQPAYSFKTCELDFQILKEEPGFRPAPYLASRGFTWIQKDSDAENYDKALEEYLIDSHRIVSLGLTKKLQKELGLNQD